MCSAPRGSAAEDLTAPARIRDAAIDRYGRDGFGASLRAIAADAGVSGALIVHHFGSKAALRAACDTHVLAAIEDSKLQALGARGGPSLLDRLATLDGYAPLTRYILRTLQEGGPLARSLVERMVEDTVTAMAAGVEAGTIRPTDDARARAGILVRLSLGALLVEATLDPDAVSEDAAAFLRHYTERWTAPLLELYSHGLFTDTRFLEQLVDTAEPVDTAGGDPTDREGLPS